MGKAHEAIAGTKGVWAGFLGVTLRLERSSGQADLRVVEPLEYRLPQAAVVRGNHLEQFTVANSQFTAGRQSLLCVRGYRFIQFTFS